MDILLHIRKYFPRIIVHVEFLLALLVELSGNIKHCGGVYVSGKLDRDNKVVLCIKLKSDRSPVSVSFYDPGLGKDSRIDK